MSQMVKVFTDGDVEVCDNQGNLRMSLRGQQALTISHSGIQLRECGAEAKISPAAIESTKLDITISGIYDTCKYGIRFPFTCSRAGHETREYSHTHCR